MAGCRPAILMVDYLQGGRGGMVWQVLCLL